MGFKDTLKKYTEEATEIVLGFMPNVEDESELLYEAMRYSVANGGKRVRPILVRESYIALGGSEDKLEYVYPFMAAIEFIHSYSLVHDDLPEMDNDMYRRGKLTTHAKYGADMGILAGDGLLNLASETAAIAMQKAVENNESEMMARTIKAFNVMVKKSGAFGMVGGQVVDVINTGLKINDKTLEFIYKLKTGALLEASLMIGAILAGRSDDEVELVESIGTKSGLAFQIKDDVLDEIGDKETLGKDVHSDVQNGKVTYVTIHGIDESSKMVEKLTNDTIPAMESLGIRDSFVDKFLMYLINREK